MTNTRSIIFGMIRYHGATIGQLINATGRDATFIRCVISDIRSRGFNVTYSNSTYKIEA